MQNIRSFMCTKVAGNFIKLPRPCAPFLSALPGLDQLAAALARGTLHLILSYPKPVTIFLYCVFGALGIECVAAPSFDYH